MTDPPESLDDLAIEYPEIGGPVRGIVVSGQPCLLGRRGDANSATSEIGKRRFS
jgi:hypothetical protein